MIHLAETYYQDNLHRIQRSRAGNIIVIVAEPPYGVKFGGRFNSVEEARQAFPEIGSDLTSTERCLVKRLDENSSQPKYRSTPGRGS